MIFTRGKVGKKSNVFNNSSNLILEQWEETTWREKWRMKDWASTQGQNLTWQLSAHYKHSQQGSKQLAKIQRVWMNKNARYYIDEMLKKPLLKSWLNLRRIHDISAMLVKFPAKNLSPPCHLLKQKPLFVGSNNVVFSMACFVMFQSYRPPQRENMSRADRGWVGVRRSGAAVSCTVLGSILPGPLQESPVWRRRGGGGEEDVHRTEREHVNSYSMDTAM